jgi:hypothetical protein
MRRKRRTRGKGNVDLGEKSTLMMRSSTDELNRLGGIASREIMIMFNIGKNQTEFLTIVSDFLHFFPSIMIASLQ